MTERLLKRAEVERAVGLSRSAIYRLMDQGKFPRPVIVGAKAVRWFSAEIQDFISSRPRSNGAKPKK